MGVEFFVSGTECAGEAAASEHARGAGCGYSVAWSINPHMRPGHARRPRLEAAAQQHRALISAIRSTNATVRSVGFVHGAYDSVFLKDNAVLRSDRGHRRALMAAPRFVERAREQHARRAALASLGFSIEDAGVPIEGGDVVMLPDGAGALLGYGFRSSSAAAVELSSFLDVPVTTLELRDPRVQHLDVALAVLDDGTALVCADALTDDSMRRLERTRGISQVVIVPLSEALAFALDFIQVGRTVIAPNVRPTVGCALEARGLRTIYTPLHEFLLAGGGAGCLVARVHGAEADGAERARAA